MERKNKKELLLVIEEKDKSLQKYKSRLHDIIESYKHLLAEKDTLQNSIKILTETNDVEKYLSEESSCAADSNEDSVVKKNDACIQSLKSSLGALTLEKSRIEKELKADRKNILQQKDALERKLAEKENKWLMEKENYESQIIELRKKIGNQQREREKEQQDHVLMLKELQNILASERAAKEKLEEQISELQQKYSGKISEKKCIEYENSLDELQTELKLCKDQLNVSKSEVKKKDKLLNNMQEEIEKVKLLYQTKIDEEKNRAEMSNEKLEMLIYVKENRIANLENRISELSAMVGDHDKLRQQDQLTIQKLKARISQLQIECSAFSHSSTDDSKLWEYGEASSGAQENLHSHCQLEISQLKEELEQYKLKCESNLREKYNKTAVLLNDVKAGKEIKELKSKISQLQDQLNSCKSQLKLNEEYHNKITFNLEKACEDLKLLHKEELAQLEASHKTHLLEFEHQIQKQRERTLLLLEEKDKEISQLKSSFLSSFVKKENKLEEDVKEVELSTTDQESAANILSHSLISSKNDGHILHYVQELSRKDVEISNLRHSRIQLESNVRKLQQTLGAVNEKYFEEVDALKSRIKLLESTQDVEGTNVEYLKNVILRFLKCNDPSSRKHMINAISTILHFTNSEIQDIKGCV